MELLFKQRTILMGPASTYGNNYVLLDIISIRSGFNLTLSLRGPFNPVRVM